MTKTVMIQPLNEDQKQTVASRMKNMFPRQGDVFIFKQDNKEEQTVITVRVSASKVMFVEFPSWNRFCSDDAFVEGTCLYNALLGIDVTDFELVSEISVSVKV